MKTKLSLIVLLTQLFGCQTATYLDSRQKLLSSSNGCSGEVYNYGERKEHGYVAIKQCVDDLAKQNGKPENIEIGQKEITQCLKDKGYEILFECRATHR